MSHLKLYLFGPPRLENQGVPVDVRPRKALALLIYLAVTNQPHGRDALATLFWPESDQVAARASLRRTFYLLQQALPIELLATTGDTIRLLPHEDFWLDISAFQTILDKSLPAQAPVSTLDEQDQEALVEAASLYTDDFLAGFSLEDAPGFDEWHFFQQETLRRRFGLLLLQLKQCYSAAGDFGRAIDYARRWLALDPLHEPAHRELMLLYAWAGQQAAALRQYQECRRILSEELGVEPEEATGELYQAIRNKQTPAPPVTVAPPLPVTRSDVATPSAGAPPASPQSFPQHTTEFVGRGREIAHIHRLLLHEANCRLLTLTGPSGIGKTRLALEVVRQILAEAHSSLQPARNDATVSTELFADGIVFVPLTSVSEPSGLAAAIAAAAGLQFGNGLSSQQQLLTYLHDKQMLLVLDHVEHLLAGTPLLAEILRAAPKIKILATSIESIHLQDAWILPVSSLSFPAEHGESQTPLRDYDAIRLFEERARRVRASFVLEDEQAHVVRICQLVEGMPLAIELAASWLKVLSAQKIAGEIERSIDILTTGYRDVPSRHRSMRAVLEQSWNLLLQPERAVFKRLSILRGGFTAEAAHAVAGAELMMLAALVDKSLLHLHQNGRYHCHELLRHFAAEQLLLWTDESDEVRARHCAYFMDFLKRHGQGIKGRGQKEALAEISADIGNVMPAWRTAVAERAIPALAAAAQCIWLFSHYRGMLDEGEAAFVYALGELAGEAEAPEAASPALAELVAFLYAGQGWMQGRRGDLESGRALMEKGIALLRQLPQRSPEIEAFAISYLALTAQYQERQLEARQIVKQSLDSYTALGDLWGMAVGLEIAGTAALGYGQLEEAKQLLGQCLTIAQAAGEPRSRLLAMTYLGSIAVTTGEYATAKTLLDDALAMSTELGDRIATSVILTQLGKYALEQGEHEAALHHLERSLANSRAAGVNYPGEVLDWLCATRCAQGNLNEAEQIGRQALQMAQERGIQRRILTSLSMLGRVAHARQDYAQAVELQTEALVLCQSVAHEPDTAAILRYLADSEAAGGASYHVAGRVHYHEALQLALKHRLAPVALGALVGVAELLRHIHDSERAERLLQLVAAHPACPDEARRRARHLLADAEPIPRVAGDAALAWQAAAQEALDLLARPDWGQARQLTRFLPSHPTPFVGRQQEIADICQNLANSKCRLLTLVGLGGTGKTRLAIQVALHLAESEKWHRLFDDGIIFVPLAAVTEKEGLVVAITEAVGISSYSASPLHGQLLHALSHRRLLLILDNFEQVAAGAELLGEILAAAPAVKFLVTSRVALEVPEAWFYPVGGMSFPSDRSTRPLESFEAVQLFVQCAQRVRANFSLASARQPVIRICQLVEGMPLAIELAASWLKVLIVENIADEISRGMDILSTHAGSGRSSGVPARHQSMRVVMEQTWTLLSDEEQQAFMALALFGGGFRRDAAARVAGATLPLLAQLVEKSLLRMTESGRYSIHELLRQFAFEKLQETPYAHDHLMRQYSAYYLNFLAERLHPIVGWQKETLVVELEEEIGNITASWQWALQQNDLDAVEKSLNSFTHFLWLRGHGQIGRDLFTQALQDMTRSATGRAHPRYAVVHQMLYHAAGSFCYFLCDFESSARYLESAVAAARRMGDKSEMGESLTTLGTVMAWQGKGEIAHAYLDEAAALFVEMDDLNGLSDVQHEQARMAIYEGDYAKGMQLATQSLASAEKIQRSDWIAYATMERGVSHFYIGRYDDCQQDLERALAIFEGIGHPVGTAFALGELAWLIWATGGAQSAEAETRARRSLEIVRKVGHRLQISYRLAQLAQFANDRGDYSEAARFAQEGLALATAINTPHFLSQNLCALAEAAYRQQEFQQARRYLAQACLAVKGPGLQGRVLLTLYHAALLLGLEAEACALEQPERSLNQQSQAISWLELYRRHPAAWHLFKERAARRLAYMRAQYAHAAALAGEVRVEEAGLDELLASATELILAWAEEVDPTHSALPSLGRAL
jgi:predicted ATPase/DNA-binding SARP family transcriptional activator